jgi:hypothetical protein
MQVEKVNVPRSDGQRIIAELPLPGKATHKPDEGGKAGALAFLM